MKVNFAVVLTAANLFGSAVAQSWGTGWAVGDEVCVEGYLMVSTEIFDRLSSLAAILSRLLCFLSIICLVCAYG